MNMTEKEAAATLRFSEKTLARRRKAGAVGFHRDGKGKITYSPEQIEAYRRSTLHPPVREEKPEKKPRTPRTKTPDQREHERSLSDLRKMGIIF